MHANAVKMCEKCSIYGLQMSPILPPGIQAEHEIITDVARILQELRYVCSAHDLAECLSLSQSPTPSAAT